MINDKNIKPDTLTKGSPSSVSAPDLAQLQAQIRDMQMEIDILKETINVLKKDPGIDQAALKNREKAVMIDALKSKYPLPDLLKRLGLSKSSYYYQEAAQNSLINIAIFALGYVSFSGKINSGMDTGAFMGF